MKAIQEFQVKETVLNAITAGVDPVLMEHYDRVVSILLLVEYKPDHELVVTVDQGLVWIQARFWRPDIVSGLNEWGYAGKAPVTPEATTSQIVQMAFGLFKGLEEHEAREQFRYQGARVFGPHIDINALIEAAADTDHEFGTR